MKRTRCAFCRRIAKYEGVHTGVRFCEDHLVRYYLGLHLTGQ